MRQVLIALFLTLMPSTLWGNAIEGNVVKVADGDTITIKDDSGNKHRIRLGGIDAPEKNQPYGKESTQSLLELTSGKPVVIEYEKRDRYNRIVGKVLVDPPGEVFCMALDCVKKIDAGLEQIKRGLAWHYKKYQGEQSVEDRGAYGEAEVEAREKRLGLWKSDKPMAPWKWRRR
jgi:endonuclease YncB( thermonuclease family)